MAYLWEFSNSHLQISFRPLIDSSEITSLPLLVYAIPLYSSVPCVPLYFTIAIPSGVLLLIWNLLEGSGSCFMHHCVACSRNTIVRTEGLSATDTNKILLKIVFRAEIINFHSYWPFPSQSNQPLSMTADELGHFQIKAFAIDWHRYFEQKCKNPGVFSVVKI